MNRMLRSAALAAVSAAALNACATAPARAPEPEAAGLTGAAQAALEPPPAFTPEPGDQPAPPRADADMQRVLDAFASLEPKPLHTLTPAEARAQPTAADAVAQTLRAQGRNPGPIEGVVASEIMYPGSAGMLPALVYRPVNAPMNAPLPVILYFHGGGWVIASPTTYDASARALAKQTGAIVVSAGYRQAPEHKFPAAHDDAAAAYRWLTAAGSSLGGDPRRIALAGESAGGNLAVNTAIFARDNGLPAPVHVLSVYPIAQNNFGTPAYRRNASAKPLSKPAMQWFAHYAARTPADVEDPRINLVAANLQGLPPTTIITAEIDPLQDDGRLLAGRMQAAGTRVELRNYDGVTHEFFGMAPVVRDAVQAQAYAVGRLRAALRR